MYNITSQVECENLVTRISLSTAESKVLGM
jgi:hypothetical protein